MNIGREHKKRSDVSLHARRVTSRSTFYSENRLPCCTAGCSIGILLAFPACPKEEFRAAGLHCGIVLAIMGCGIGARFASELDAEGCARSFSCPVNVSANGFRRCGEPPFFPADEEFLKCLSFKRCSVSRSLASRASSSWFCEFTACFLVGCQRMNQLGHDI